MFFRALEKSFFCDSNHAKKAYPHHFWVYAIDRITGGFSLCAYKYAARYGAKVTFTPDMLRHQFSADLHNDGAGSAVICNLMGHKSAAISLDCVVSDGIRAINHRNAEKHELIQ